MNQHRPFSLKVRLRRNRMKTGQTSFTNQSETIDQHSQPVQETSRTVQVASVEKIGASSTIINPISEVENTDPEALHIRMPRKIGRIRRWLSRQKAFWKPEPTAAELEQRQLNLRNLKIRRAMFVQMILCNKIIPQAYANLGMEYQRKNKSKLEAEKPSRVLFGMWLYSAEGNTIFGKVRCSPYGTNPADLVKKEVLTALSVAVGHPVGGKCGDNGEGVIIWISLMGTRDIPDMFSFSSALPLISESAPPLTFFVGAGENGVRHTYNLEEMPHLLIGGTTGSGKSVALMEIIATFAARNNPDTVRFVLCDMKKMELIHFEGIPHLLCTEDIPNGIVTEDKQVIPMLKHLEKENNSRQELFAKNKVHNLAEWNRKHRNRKLPRIVVAIDEIARIMRKPDTRNEFIDLTYDLASTARATGIYLILSTQFAKDKYITTDIKMNIPGRLAFSCPDLQGSVALIDTGEAVNLYPPPGRGIFMHGVNKYKFQGPMISSNQIAEIVKNAKEGKTTGAMAAGELVSEMDIIKWALTENNSFMNARQAFQEFNGRIEWAGLVELLDSMDDKEYIYDDIKYKVLSPAGQRARQLVKVLADDTDV